MNITKRSLALVLTVVLVLTLLPVPGQAEETGSLGSTTYWTFDEETGLLKIDGYGIIDSTSSLESIASKVKHIKISGSISYFHYTGMLTGFSNLESITIPFIGPMRKDADDEYLLPFGSIFSSSSYSGSYRVNQTYFSRYENFFGTIMEMKDSQLCYLPNSLKKVTVTGGLIHPYAFQSCRRLESISIPSSTTTIEEYAFSYCWNLTDIRLPNKVRRIEEYAFIDCESLEEMIIPPSVSTIKEGAFEDCESLKRIIFGGGAPSIADDAFTGVTCYGLYPADESSWTESKLRDYGGDITWVPTEYGECIGEHIPVTLPGTKPTCTKPGISEGSSCQVCGAVLVPQVELPAAHTYSHDYDPRCDRCGETREVDMTRPMVDMHRMYNPNTGEHFYTGSIEERDNLIGHGWQYEGVGFTFPLTTGDPVHRLFQPSTGEHLYTMDETEKAALMEAGWNYEGIAFNSGFENEVPQYRLHNPNATVGAYHFTASAEERDDLLNEGWEYQGIGWYSLGFMR